MSAKEIVRRSRRSRSDLLGQYQYIFRDNPQAAETFLDEVEQRISLIVGNPLACSLFDTDHPRLADLRHCRVSSRFRNYIVFYRPIENGIEIVRVLHAAQDLEDIISAE